MDDPTQMKPLTPMMFLQKTPHNEIPDLDRGDINLSKRMRYRQKLAERVTQTLSFRISGSIAAQNQKQQCFHKSGRYHSSVARRAAFLAHAYKIKRQ